MKIFLHYKHDGLGDWLKCRESCAVRKFEIKEIGTEMLIGDSASQR